MSKDMENDFKQYIRDRDAKLNIKEFNVLVLTSGFWPYSKDHTNFIPPQEVCARTCVFACALRLYCMLLLKPALEDHAHHLLLRT